MCDLVVVLTGAMSGPADVIICDNGTGVGACCPLYPVPTSFITPPSQSWLPRAGCPSPVPSVVLAGSWYRYPGESKGCLCDGAVPGLTRPACPANPCPLCMTPFACSSSSAAWQGTTCRGTPFPAWWDDPCCAQRRGPSGTGTTCRWVPHPERPAPLGNAVLWLIHVNLLQPCRLCTARSVKKKGRPMAI